MTDDKKNRDIDDKINLLKDEIKGFDDILPESDSLYKQTSTDNQIEKLREIDGSMENANSSRPFPEGNTSVVKDSSSPILKTPPVSGDKYFHHSDLEDEMAHSLSGTVRELDKKINLLAGVISKATDDVTKNSDRELFEKLDNVININVEVSRKLDSLITSMNEGFSNLRIIAKDIDLRNHSRSVEGRQKSDVLPDFDSVKKLPEERNSGDPQSLDSDVRPLRPNLAPRPPTGSSGLGLLKSKEGNKYDL